MMQKLCCFYSDYNNVKTLDDLCEERRIRMEVYQRENEHLQKQIEEVNRQIQSIKTAKDMFEKLKAQGETHAVTKKATDQNVY